MFHVFDLNGRFGDVGLGECDNLYVGSGTGIVGEITAGAGDDTARTGGGSVAVNNGIDVVTDFGGADRIDVNALGYLFPKTGRCARAGPFSVPITPALPAT